MADYAGDYRFTFVAGSPEISLLGERYMIPCTERVTIARKENIVAEEDTHEDWAPSPAGTLVYLD